MRDTNVLRGSCSPGKSRWWLGLAVEIERSGLSAYFKYIWVEEATGPGVGLEEGVRVKEM